MDEAMTDRVPPQALDAEEALLGAMLLSRQAVEVGLDRLTHQDFYAPQHQSIFAAITKLYHAGAAIDPVTVSDQLETVSKAELLSIQAATPASANAGNYARLVAESAQLRRAIRLGDEISDYGYARDFDAIERAIRSADDRLARTTEDVTPALDVLDLVAREYGETEWLVRGFLERLDRLVITGPEGFGKSVLCRQIALATACGAHGLNPETRGLPPRRVLNLDLQETEQQAHRSYKWMMSRTRMRPDPGQLVVYNRPQGLDVRKRQDARWFDALVGHHKPDLVVLGPLYKSFQGSSGQRKDSEEVADEVAGFYDTLRVKHDCALVIEAHSPHGSDGDRAGYRPYGASLWLRWPEFGIGLKPQQRGEVRIVHWRGARERDRFFPDRMHEGSRWPWMPGESELNEEAA